MKMNNLANKIYAIMYGITCDEEKAATLVKNILSKYNKSNLEKVLKSEIKRFFKYNNLENLKLNGVFSSNSIDTITYTNIYRKLKFNEDELCIFSFKYFGKYDINELLVYFNGNETYLIKVLNNIDLILKDILSEEEIIYLNNIKIVDKEFDEPYVIIDNKIDALRKYRNIIITIISILIITFLSLLIIIIISR